MKKTITFSIIMSLVCTTFWAQQGLQIMMENHPYTINFETTVNMVNYGGFKATGFSPNTTTNGQLDSNAWEVVGMSDGDLFFGGTKTTGDFARGVSSIPVGIGGIYSFLLPSNNKILGIQATTADFTPGYIGFKIQNQTGGVIHTLEIKYDTYVYNDRAGSGYFSLSHSSDNSTYTEILESNIITPGPAAASPTWVANPMDLKITGLSIAPNDYYYVRWNIKNPGPGELDQLGIDNISFSANPDPLAFVYFDNEDSNSSNNWSPYDPNTNPSNVTSETSFSISNGIAILSEDFLLGTLSVNSGATLKIKKSLIIENNLINNGHIIFESTTSSTGQLGSMANATNSGSGDVTVQRYIPARNDLNGAYRYLASAVNSDGSIQANWQEGASSMANPNPGFGIFITGSVDGSNGFDATPAGAPSMFTFDNGAQQYFPIPNTDSDLLIAGKPYSVYIWGDRGVDILTSNDPNATPTTLQATGSLAIGDQPVFLEGAATDFNLIGNPYQAIVNMHDVISLSTNVAQDFYYVWDPTLGTRGGYTTVSLETGYNNSFGGSEANQYLMPGQAVWVVSTAANAIVNFTEETKFTLADATAVFRTPDNMASIGLLLYQADRFENNESLSDAVRVNFTENGDNSVQASDAPKLSNLDENISVLNDGANLSIENRSFPIDGETIAVSINQYRTTNYVFGAIVEDLPADTKAFLKDNYLQTKTELINNETTPISFSVQASNVGSIASDRFSIVFERSPLGVNENVAQKLSIYPNPVKNGEFFIEIPGISGEKVQVSLFNVLGQKVYDFSTTASSNGRISVKSSAVKAGVYIVKTEQNGKILTGKVMVQ